MVLFYWSLGHKPTGWKVEGKGVLTRLPNSGEHILIFQCFHNTVPEMVVLKAILGHELKTGLPLISLFSTIHTEFAYFGKSSFTSKKAVGSPFFGNQFVSIVTPECPYHQKLESRSGASLPLVVFTHWRINTTMGTIGRVELEKIHSAGSKFGWVRTAVVGIVSACYTNVAWVTKKNKEVGTTQRLTTRYNQGVRFQSMLVCRCPGVCLSIMPRTVPQ
jgi:hypothetical protein